jgi:hypothetical protein
MTTWAFIYEHPGGDPHRDRFVLDRDGQRSLMVPVPDSNVAAAVARQLVAEGVELIELCGGFPVAVAAAVADAVGDGVPVGHVTFSADAIQAAAAYNARFEQDTSRP